jgi:hypothetical protein
MDGARTARLLFDLELTAGVADGGSIDIRQVRAVTRVSAVPGPARRVTHQIAYKLGRLGYERDVVGPLMSARRAVLGERAGGRPRFLVRVDEFPHYRAWDDPDRFGTECFARFHEILAAAGVPYLLAVLPRISHEPLVPVGSVPNHAAPRTRVGQTDRDSPAPGGPGDIDQDSRPLDGDERAMLARLGTEGVSLALHGLTHRTRHSSTRRHSELCGLSLQETAALLDAGLAELGAQGVHPQVFVPPYNRFDAAQLGPLGERFQVVCGGPESIGHMGFQRTPQWRGDTVYLPSYAPFYGHAAEVLPAVQRAVEVEWDLWIPVVLHWGWEADAGWHDLERLVTAIAPYAARWGDFMAAIARSRKGSYGHAGEPGSSSDAEPKARR